MMKATHPSTPTHVSGCIAIRATFTYHPPEALPRIAEALLSMEPTLRQDAVYAIALYGTSAKEHVGLLRNLLSVETDPGRIQLIRRAIAALSGDRVR